MVCKDWIHLAFVSAMLKWPWLPEAMQESQQKGQKWQPQTEKGAVVSSSHKHEGEGVSRQCMNIYMEVISLRAWSSSSLMALYFSFWAYSSSMSRKWKAEMQGHGEWSRDGGWARVADAIPTRQQGKGNAWRGWCRSGWPMQEACDLFLKRLKQKQREQKPIRK